MGWPKKKLLVPLLDLRLPWASDLMNEGLVDNLLLIHWRSTPGHRQAKVLILGSSVQRTKELLALHRNEARIITKLFTGHCHLRRHLHLIGIANRPTCRRCQDGDETPLHILCGPFRAKL